MKNVSLKYQIKKSILSINIIRLNNSLLYGCLPHADILEPEFFTQQFLTPEFKPDHNKPETEGNQYILQGII
jgi:hypothetical protein